MKKLTLLIWVCLAVVSLGRLAGAQEATIRKTAAFSGTSSDRVQDGLNGPVRRVRIETAKIVVKDGKPIEGSRVLQGSTTYDISGRKTDAVALPVEGSAPSGKQQYGYDDKGNITEMVVRGDDGSILSKETYQYEFDELGNWKKMTTSVAVYEDGKLGFEPVEVTYRTIAYYYSQAVDKMAAASASKPSSVSAPSNIDPVPVKSVPAPQTVDGTTARESKTVSNENETVAVGGAKNGNKNPATSPVSSAPEDGTSAKNGSTIAAETPSTSREVPSVPPAKVPVIHVSEVALRSAAINVPPAELPSAAELTGQKGSVEVQVVINQKGEVISARARSDNSLLNEAAEAAAVKARFSPDKLSPDPAIVSGVITYDFAAPSKETPVVALPTGSADENAKATAPNGGASQPKPDTVASSRTNSASLSVVPSVGSSSDAGHFYREGLSHLRAGRYTEAVNDLRQAVYLNPEDALAYAKLGVAYAGLGQHKETVTVLKLAIRIKAEVVDAEAYYRLGEAYTVLGKHSDALRAFKQAMYITRAQVLESDPSKYAGFPSVADLHYSLGLAHHNLGSFREAIKEFRQAIDLKPEFAEAYYRMALAHIGLDDRKSAEDIERTLRRLNRTLADKVATAINTAPTSFPAGLTDTGQKRRP
jgi:TonB family protein